MAAAADGGSAPGAGIPSLRGRCGNLSAGRGKDSASGVVSGGAGIFPVARQPDLFPQSDRIFSARDALAHGSGAVLVACGVNFFAAPRMLGVVRPVLLECEGEVGRSL